MHRILAAAVLGTLAGIQAAAAGEPSVVSAVIERTGRDTYIVHASIRHADEGWSHYADKCDVLAPDGTVLSTRVLMHPHVDEQPFTRSQPEIVIAREITSVTVRAHDNIHGYGSKTVTIDVPH